MGRFEEMMERLVEGSLARLFAGQLEPQGLAAQLARAMEDNAEEELAPDHYWVYLNPTDFEQLQEAEPELARLLREQVLALAQQAGLDLTRAPVVELLTHAEVARRAVSVTAAITGRSEEHTQAMNLAAVRSELSQQPDGQTYLIIEGQRHVVLTRPAYTIGRRLDCDIVLSDPRVSRRHAQLRWRFGRYVLYDLGSSSGTTVNGEPATEVVLEPGDVFSLGGVDIIYGRDSQDARLTSDGDTTRSWPVRHKPESEASDPT